MSVPLHWVRPDAPPILALDEVHVWRFDLDEMIPGGLALERQLSAEERDRARRFRFGRDRERYLAGRAALRGILAGYVEARPETLRFVRAPQGKPALLAAPEGLEFNLTHADWCAMVAVARGRRVGVDVESIRLGHRGMDVARRFFAHAEVETLLAAPPEERAATFVRCWTRKEAYVKARGDGLSLSLQDFEVPLATGATRALASSREDSAEVERWSLRELVPAPCHLGALVVEGEGFDLRAWEWAPSERHILAAS
jgi:4'-phosphopantetheinyl transferase